VATAQSVESDRLDRSIRAMEEERTRWARELHDETLQGLGALRVLLATARRAEGGEATGRAVDQAIEQVTAEIKNLRALITDLRPAALDEIGLAPALDALISQRREQASIDVVSSVELSAQRLTPELETTIYRLVQEALTNVAKHARAGRVSISVVEDDKRVSVAVKDNGVGFDETDLDLGGFGLGGMRERAGLAGGELTITSEKGRGTSVTATFPVRHADRTAPPVAAPPGR
jgi:signal transduction histidine kinase